MIAAIAANWRVALRDGAGLAAVAAIAYGAWSIYTPAGFLVGGTLVLTGVVLAARGAK